MCKNHTLETLEYRQQHLDEVRHYYVPLRLSDLGFEDAFQARLYIEGLIGVNAEMIGWTMEQVEQRLQPGFVVTWLYQQGRFKLYVLCADDHSAFIATIPDSFAGAVGGQATVDAFVKWIHA